MIKDAERVLEKLSSVRDSMNQLRSPIQTAPSSSKYVYS